MTNTPRNQAADSDSDSDQAGRPCRRQNPPRPQASKAVRHTLHGSANDERLAHRRAHPISKRRGPRSEPTLLTTAPTSQLRFRIVDISAL
jgi:hypothetical protein